MFPAGWAGSPEFAVDRYDPTDDACDCAATGKDAAGYAQFCRVHKSPRVSPAMTAGVMDLMWDMSDAAALISVQEAPIAKGHTRRRRHTWKTGGRSSGEHSILSSSPSHV